MKSIDTQINELDITQQDFYKSITNLLNLKTYNEHKFHKPTTTPQLKMPNSQKRHGWTEEEWFESLVQKIYLRLNYQTQFSLDRIGGFTNIKEQKLLWLIVKGFCIQIELMVYNNCWATVLDTGSVQITGGSAFNASEVIDEFWFAEPYSIFKAIGLINEWGFNEIDKDGAFDFSEFATQKYADKGDDMAIAVAANYTNERVQEAHDYINNTVVGTNEKFKKAYEYIDQQDEKLDNKIDDIELEAYFQLTDSDGNNVGTPNKIGLTNELVIAGIAKPLYDKENKRLTLETIKEIPPTLEGQLSDVPISKEDGGSDYGITATWAYEQVDALSVCGDTPHLPTLIQTAKNIYNVEFIDEEPLVEEAPISESKYILVERQEETIEFEDRADEEPIDNDPLRVFNAIRDGQDINNVLENIYTEQLRLKELLEPTITYVDFQKAHSGEYLEENIENWKNKNKE